MKIEPTSEEAAAIVTALAVAMVERKEPERADMLRRNQWRLAGLLRRQVPPGMKLEGSLWAYSSWEGMV